MQDDSTAAAGGKRKDHAPRPRQEGVTRWLKIAASVIHQHPSTLIVPLVMLAAMLAVGCWGVLWGADKQAQQAQQQARSFAETYLTKYKHDIQQVVRPLSFLDVLARQTPSSWALLNSSILPYVMPDIIRLADDNEQRVLSVFLAPQGHVGAQYITPFMPDGFDFFEGLTNQDKIDTEYAVTVRGLTLYGPFHGIPEILLSKGFLTAEQEAAFADFWGVGALLPVFVPISSMNSSSGTLPLDVPPANCQPCSEVVDGQVFWGFVGSVVAINQYVNPEKIAAAGYRFTMTAPSRNGFASRQFVRNGTIVVAKSDAAVKDPVAVSAVMDATNATWSLCVSPTTGTWRPTWEAPLLANVVLVSVALAAMQFLALLAWRQHRMLLEALLPRSVLEKLQEQHDYGSTVVDERGMASGTPAETMLCILSATLQDKPVNVRDAVLVRTTLLRGADVYRPLDLGEKIKASNLDSDVASALARQLDNSYEGSVSGARTSSYRDDPGALLLRRSSNLSDDSSVAGSKDRDLLNDSLRGALATILFSNDDVKSDGFQIKELSSSIAWGDFTAEGQAIHDTKVILAGSGRQASHEGDGVPPRRAPTLLASPRPAAPVDPVPISDKQAMLPALPGARSGAAPAMRTSQDVTQHPDGPGRGGALAVPRQLRIEQLERQLHTADDWVFDTMALATCANSRPLSALGFYVLKSTGLMDAFKLKGAVVTRFLQKVESLYLENPYHSAAHATDVLQRTHVLLQRGGLAGHYADALGQLACYVAAIVHDLGHLGRTNDFLCAISHELALRYNDKAPLENHHVSRAFEIMKEPGLDFLSVLPREQRVSLRRMVIELVLATDMKQHFSVVSQFKTLHQAAVSAAQEKLLQAGSAKLSWSLRRAAQGRSSRISATSAMHSDRQQAVSSERHTPTAAAAATGAQIQDAASNLDDAGKLLTLQLAIKCADLGHLASPLQLHLQWVAALEEEYFRQGDAEKAEGLPVSPLFDRSKPGITKSQVGFFNIVVLPLFQAMAAVLPDAQALNDAVLSNYRYWQDKERQWASMTVQ